MAKSPKKTKPKPPTYVGVAKAAKILGRGLRTVYEHVEALNLGLRIDTRVLLSEDDLAALEAYKPVRGRRKGTKKEA